MGARCSNKITPVCQHGKASYCLECHPKDSSCEKCRDSNSELTQTSSKHRKDSQRCIHHRRCINCNLHDYEVVMNFCAVKASNGQILRWIPHQFDYLD